MAYFNIYRYLHNTFKHNWHENLGSKKLTYIFVVDKLLSHIPFESEAGIFFDPVKGWTVIYTDSRNIDDWYDQHKIHIKNYWMANRAVHDTDSTKVTRVDFRAAQKQHQRDQQLEVIATRVQQGVKTKHIASELGVTVQQICSLKRKYLTPA